MDWIEKIFGISPDNGDGSTEAMIVTSCFIVLAIVVAVSPKLRAGGLRHLNNVLTRLHR